MDSGRPGGQSRLFISFLLGLFLIPSVVLAEPTLPVRTGSVVDAADIIRPSQEQTLAAKAGNLRSSSNVELVVVTLPGLQGYSIEIWGRALGNRWDIGGSAARGVLLIVAPNDREVRIEVGDGLSSRLTDAAASSIISNVIVPQFRTGEMSSGILAGVDAITDAIAHQQYHGGTAPQRQFSNGLNWYAVASWSVFGILILLTIYRLMRDGLDDPRGYGLASRDTPSNSTTTDDDDDDRRHGWFSSNRSDSGRSSSSNSSSSSGSGFGGHGSSGRW